MPEPPMNVAVLRVDRLTGPRKATELTESANVPHWLWSQLGSGGNLMKESGIGKVLRGSRAIVGRGSEEGESDDPNAPRLIDRLGPIGTRELTQNTRHMLLDSLLANIKTLTDVSVGDSTRCEAKHFDFTVAQ